MRLTNAMRAWYSQMVIISASALLAYKSRSQFKWKAVHLLKADKYKKWGGKNHRTRKMRQTSYLVPGTTGSSIANERNRIKRTHRHMDSHWQFQLQLCWIHTLRWCYEKLMLGLQKWYQKYAAVDFKLRAPGEKLPLKFSYLPKPG